MDKRKVLISLMSLSLTLIFLGGCITSQQSKFYILTPAIYDSNTNNNHAKNIRLGFGPVSIAKYLDRSQLVVRLSPNQIRLEEFHQWAGSPRDDIPAILFENISSVLGIDTIYKYPWQSYADIDYQIVVEIIELDGRPDDSVRVVARWEIIKGNSKSNFKTDINSGKVKSGTVKSGRADFIEPVSANGLEAVSGDRFDSFTAAQSSALGKLSVMIAKSLVDSFDCNFQ